MFIKIKCADNYANFGHKWLIDKQTFVMTPKPCNLRHPHFYLLLSLLFFQVYV